MKVNTIIIGAGRSGTTSLYEYLKQHPDVYFSITKEVHYFSIAELYARGESYFHSLFPDVKDQKIIATADTYLLIDKQAPERIKNYNPAMKIIILLRDPVDRAYSNYNYSINYGHEKKQVSFLGSMPLEYDRLNNLNIVDQNNLCHFYGSLYDQHVSYWMQFFPAENFIILKTDDLQKSPQQTVNQLFNFLKIEEIAIDTSQKFNKAAKAKSKYIQQLLLNRDHPLRKIMRIFLKPFRNILIRSGIIDKISGMNKTEAVIEPLKEAERKAASAYFEKDLLMLDTNYHIRFPKFNYIYPHPETKS